MVLQWYKTLSLFYIIGVAEVTPRWSFLAKVKAWDWDQAARHELWDCFVLPACFDF